MVAQIQRQKKGAYVGKVSIRVVEFEAENLQQGELAKFFDAVFPSPHPPVENIRAVGDGMRKMLDDVAGKIMANEPFKLHVENRADELRRTPGSTTAAARPPHRTPPAKTAPTPKPKPGRPAKKTPVAPPAATPAQADPAKS
jgi:hypothetical protein